MNEMRAVDLHVHSNRSDGTFSPTKLVDYAMEKGLAAFALTDHDTVDGLEEAVSYADGLRRTLPTEKARSVPEVIPGIELSTEYQGKDVHVVGLYINHHNKVFQEYLKDFVESRISRNRKMCALLQDSGIAVSYDALLEEFPDAVITRAHYAKYLLNHGYTKSMKEGFERYVGTTVPDENISLLNLLEGKENLTDLTKELVRQLIDAIYVYNNRRIEIVFKFQDKNTRSDRKDLEAMI